MNERKALLIVDMQDFFFENLDQADKLNDKICEQIREYREECRPIVVLEYRSNPYDPDDKRCGPTNGRIKEELEDYGHLAIFGKDEDGGHEFIRDYVDGCMCGTDEIVLVGVNLDCCVMATAKGLARNHQDKQITILEDCCDSFSYETAFGGYDKTVEDTESRINYTQLGNLRMLINQRGVDHNDD
jgi:nicotinamidase-related amidase